MKKKIVEATTVCNKEYKLVRDEDYWDPYFDEGDYKYPVITNRKNNLKYWKQKKIFKYQYRSYRTWKYNRRTQWKN